MVMFIVIVVMLFVLVMRLVAMVFATTAFFPVT